MLNHSSAKQYEETTHVTKPTKNKTLNVTGSAKEREGIPHVTKSTTNKTLKLNGRGARREETPHVSRSTQNKTHNLNGRGGRRQDTPHLNQTTRTNTIINALKRRAQAVLNDSSLDAQSRAIIRYALEINDPWLAELVRRADAGETIIYTVNSLKHPHPARKIQTKKRSRH